jgi:1-acyl-sn-glycerol-3-phosphate acyltransferase
MNNPISSMSQALRSSVAWLRRARQLVPAADALVLLSPPLLIPRLMRFSIARSTGHEAHAPADDVRARDPEFIALMMDLCRAVGGLWFRPTISGVENVPAEGPALLVGNHNGGLVPVDSYFTGLAIWDHFQGRRSMYSLVHDFVFEDPLLRGYALRLGMLRAGSESAHHVFEQGHALLVYPGSDLDTFRPFSQRGKVVLGGRTGFIGLALRERVPIVPVVSAGTHEQLVVLTRGDRLARFLRMHARARTEVFPLMLALPWGITTGFVPYLPLPAQTSICFGEPIRWPELGPQDAGKEEVLERCYREVEARMQQMLDRLAANRRFLLGKARISPAPPPTPPAAVSRKAAVRAPAERAAAAPM